VLSIATAMDAFLAGVALGITGMEVWLAALLVTISVFIFTLTGLAGGKNFSMAFAKNIAITGGIFIMMAAASFLSRMFL
jgi:putative Mn2+ efflux pump MntP